MPFGEDQYRKYLELAREPIDINEYIQKAWAEILPENPRVCRKHKELGFLEPQINCNECIRYNKNMIEKTFDNIVRCGFIKKNKGYICPEHRKNKTGKTLKPIDDCINCKPYLGKICEFHKLMGVKEPDSNCIYCKEGHVSIELYPDGQKWLDGKLRGGFPKLVLESLKRGWGYQLRLPKAIDATLDILSEFSSLENGKSLSSIEIFNNLAFYQDGDENKKNQISTLRKKGGYDFNIASEGSKRTLREILKLLVEMRALEKVGQGRYSRGKKIDSIISTLKKADMLNETENIIKNYGHKEQILDDKEKDIEVKSLLAKYYIYVQSGGIKKDRWFLKKIHKLLFKTPKNLPVEFSTGRKRRFDLKKIAAEKKSLREIAAEKWGIEEEVLHGLYYSDLNQIINAISEDEVYFLLDSFSTKFNKTILDRLCHDNGTFNFPQNFNLYRWQNEAVNQWINGDGKDKHENFKGIVSVVTGAGKTVMALKAMKEYFKQFPNAKVSVIVPTRVLMYQWAHEISKLLAISSSQIGFRGDGFKDSFNDKQNERKIIIFIVNSAIQDNFLRNDISQLDDQINHLLIADECHRYTGEKFQQIFDCRYNATLGLSATPIEEENIQETEINTTNDANSATLFNNLGPIFYNLNYKEALNEGIISQFTVNYIGVELTKVERIEYDVKTKKLAKVLEKIRVRYGNRLDLMPGSNLDQKLQTIIKSDQNPDSAIGQYFKLVRERRDTIYGAVNRKGVYYDILQKAIKKKNKTIVFHEKINQLNEIVTPMELREQVRIGRTKKNIQMSPYEKAVNNKIELLLYDKSYRPVMYHSLHEKDHWNRWAMDWFRDDIANTMLSVKALIEGVDVPSADVGIVRVSSSSVRQRIQATGRILRKVKDGTKKSSNMYIIYVIDTVDENIFKKYDWKKELGETSDIKHCYWHPIKDDPYDSYWLNSNFEFIGQREEKSLDDLPDKSEYEDNRPPIEVDVSNLKVGDEYPGRFAGDFYHVTADGRPYKRSQFGRIFITKKEIIIAGQLIREIKGGGKLLVTPQGNMVTMVKGQGPIFLGTINPDLIRDEVKQNIESITKVKNGKMKLERPPTFEELFGNAA